MIFWWFELGRLHHHDVFAIKMFILAELTSQNRQKWTRLVWYKTICTSARYVEKILTVEMTCGMVGRCVILSIFGIITIVFELYSEFIFCTSNILGIKTGRFYGLLLILYPILVHCNLFLYLNQSIDYISFLLGHFWPDYQGLAKALL